jgi:hypothetical protein
MRGEGAAVEGLGCILGTLVDDDNMIRDIVRFLGRPSESRKSITNAGV